MPFLNPLQKATLAAITDTLFPELDPEPGDDPVLFGIDAARLELGDRLEEAIENVSDEDGQRQLKLFLRLLEMPAVNWILAGPGEDLPTQI